LILAAALLVSAAVVLAGLQIAAAVQSSRPEAMRARSLELLTMFVPALTASAADPRAILVWQPLARMGRQMFPEEFALLDRAAGSAFPFSSERLQSAHDAEYKLKAAVVEQEIAAAGTSPVLRARLDAVEGEKLDLYQRRYQEYVRVAKALQALAGSG
jgi:hypothetical protein